MREVFESLGIIAGTCICLTIFISFGIKHNWVKVIEWIKSLKSYFWTKRRARKYQKKRGNWLWQK